MDKIDEYLYKLNNTELDDHIIRSYKFFGYDYQEDFKSDLQILLDFVYTDVKIKQSQELRLSQGEFKKMLINKYGSKCVITGNPVEIQACHIIDHADGGFSDVNNGLLLENNLHYTFDNLAWTINPDTLKIEINSKKNNFTVLKYVGNKIDIQLNPFLYANLAFRYNKFVQEVNSQ